MAPETATPSMIFAVIGERPSVLRLREVLRKLLAKMQAALTGA
jgi:hypothetical protein